MMSVGCQLDVRMLSATLWGVTEIAEGPYAVIAYRVHRDGKPYPGGAWLQVTASKAQVVCATCGPLVLPELPGWTSDWLTIAGEARDHARDTGHRVAVESWNGALYGPETPDVAL